MTPDLVLVVGRAQAGKDSIVAHLRERWGYQRFAFADQLKELAYYADPVLETDEEYGPWRLSSCVDFYGWEVAKTNPEVRRFLIDLGIGVRNHIGEDAWVRALENVIDEYLLGITRSGSVPTSYDLRGNRLAVSDGRFPNEVDWARRNHGVVIRVTRPGVEAVDPNNESERHIPNLYADYDICNDGDLEHLGAAVDGLMVDLDKGLKHYDRVIEEKRVWTVLEDWDDVGVVERKGFRLPDA